MIHYNDSDYLCHHGVKGMKWGVRKSVYKSMSRADRKVARKDFKKKYNNSIQDAKDKYYSKFRNDNKAYGRLANKVEAWDRPGNKAIIEKYNKTYKKEKKYVKENVKKDLINKYGSKTVKSMQRRENAQSIAAGVAVYGALAGITYATVVRPIIK